MEKIFLVIPREDYVILEIDTKDKETNVGFIIPQAVDEAQALVRGIVRTIGTDKGFIFKDAYGESHTVYEGQLVLFEKGRGTVKVINDKEYIFINKNYIIAFIDEE